MNFVMKVIGAVVMATLAVVVAVAGSIIESPMGYIIAGALAILAGFFGVEIWLTGRHPATVRRIEGIRNIFAGVTFLVVLIVMGYSETVIWLSVVVAIIASLVYAILAERSDRRLVDRALAEYGDKEVTCTWCWKVAPKGTVRPGYRHSRDLPTWVCPSCQARNVLPGYRILSLK
jgi:hypothetical protein